MAEYLIYLRKSQKDIEAELHGEGETLARHEKYLTEFVRKSKINVTEIYREVVSGETIQMRPKMQQLLEEVRAGRWSGVIVMEIERLARGDSEDQGAIAKAFKYSNTKIITPNRTYDPNNEFDEDYFEFGLFMSRREFMTIRRRLQRGRIASVKEGKFVSSTPAFGYQKIKLEKDKGYQLIIDKEKAAVVRNIFDWYVHGSMQTNGEIIALGSNLICRKLDSMGIKPALGTNWSPSSIRDMIKNPVYIGKIRWQWEKEEKQYINGSLKKTRKKNEDYLLIEGMHEPIIHKELYQLAQQVMNKNQKYTLNSSSMLQNPLSGLIYCAKCGQMLTRLGPNKKNLYATIKCPNRYCSNISSPLELIEKHILLALNDWMKNYDFNIKNNPSIGERDLLTTAIMQAKDKIIILESQQCKTYDLLEQGIYTTDIFAKRNKNITDQMNVVSNTLTDLQKEYQKLIRRDQVKENYIPSIQHLLDSYDEIDTAEEKNRLLKNIIERVDYLKTMRSAKGERENANFSLNILPLLPIDS